MEIPATIIHAAQPVMSGSRGISRQPPATKVNNAASPSASDRSASRWWNGSVATKRHAHARARNQKRDRADAEKAGTRIIGNSKNESGSTPPCERGPPTGMITDAISSSRRSSRERPCPCCPGARCRTSTQRATSSARSQSSGVGESLLRRQRGKLCERFVEQRKLQHLLGEAGPSVAPGGDEELDARSVKQPSGEFRESAGEAGHSRCEVALEPACERRIEAALLAGK